MRTTIRIDDNILIEAKKLAAETNRTLSSIIESALRDMISRHASYEALELPALPIWGFGGTLPGVDIDDGAALRDLMEDTEARRTQFRSSPHRDTGEFSPSSEQ